MNSLKKNGTYDLVELSSRKPLKNKWVFKLKKDGNHTIKYKALVVTKGALRKKALSSLKSVLLY